MDLIKSILDNLGGNNSLEGFFRPSKIMGRGGKRKWLV